MHQQYYWTAFICTSLQEVMCAPNSHTSSSVVVVVVSYYCLVGSNRTSICARRKWLDAALVWYTNISSMCNQFSLTLQQFFLLHTIVWLTVYWIEPACASCKCTSRLLLDNIYSYSKFTGSVQHIHSNTSAVVDVVGVISYYYCLLDSTTRQNQHIPVVVGHTSQCDTSILLYHLFK